MNRKFVIGDIHGRLDALKEVLKKSEFNYNKDELIILGDIVDGGFNTYAVVEELLKIKNRILILGNHDVWFMNHIRTGWADELWLSQGGRNTIKSYGGLTQANVPITHQEFFNSGVYYYLNNGNLFVHGGFNLKNGLGKTSMEELTWNRDLVDTMKIRERIPDYMDKHIHKVNKFKRIFIGHTTTQTYGKMSPIQIGNIIMMDCGAGWAGRLAIMDIETQKYWLSKKQIPARGTESENIKKMLKEVMNSGITKKTK